MATSLRQLLLAELNTLDAYHRVCTRCGQKFVLSSDSAAWKKHFEARHPAELEALLAKARPAPPAAAAATAASTDIESVVSSVSSPPPMKKRKADSSSSTQSSLTSLFNTASSNRAVDSLARLFTQCSIAHHVADTDEFHQFMRDMGWAGKVPSPYAIKQSMLQQSQKLRAELIARLQSAPITVAADGWTNVRQEKVTNIVPILSGVAFYWCSIVNKDSANDAAWLFERYSLVFNDLIKEGVRVVAMVVDNEAVNKAAYNLLVPVFPFLIHVPCAAHTIQLVVRKCLASPPFSSVTQQLMALIHFFDAKQHRNELKRAQEIMQVSQLMVLKPNDTRWSSTLIAAQRILAMRRQLETCFDAASIPEIPNKDAFFEALVDLCAFLKPFQISTDIIQSDRATLFTVYEQFTRLLEHTRARNDRQSSLTILSRWERRINVPATVAAALLSFATLPDSLTQHSKAARDFIRDFGSHYLSYYKLCGQQTQQQIRDDLTRQIAEFNSRSGRFSGLEEEKASIKRGGEWNPRLVWALYSESTLATVALVVLSISASEAAVERTFSAQAAVHTKKRNRLEGATVEAEMFMKFNYRPLHNPLSLASGTGAFGSCTPMDDDWDADAHDVFEIPVEDEAATDVEEEEALAEEEKGDVIEAREAMDMSDVEDDAAAAVAPSAAERRRLRRTTSVVHDTIDSWLSAFITAQHLTADSRWNADLINALETASRTCPPPVPSNIRLRDLIVARLA